MNMEKTSIKTKIGNILSKAGAAGFFCATIGISMGSFKNEPTFIQLIQTFGLLFIVFFFIMLVFAILTEI